MFAPITPAKLEWLPDGTPFSPEFGDIYFSREGGAEETRHVFLAGNRLPQRWQGRRHFTIAETGFGTGLNFLTTLDAWKTTRRPGQWLYYISIEKHPIPPAEIAKLHPALEALYPSPTPGFHWRVLEEEQATLLLIFADVETALAELDAEVDAWFLDGFAPAKNEAMWSAETFRHIGRLSAPDTTAATYTVARTVRDGLAAAGFGMEKQKGFGHKREMLVAHRSGNPITRQLPQSATIIGAGLAGCNAAHVLSRHGLMVSLFERRAAPAMEASGNPAAIVMPYMAKTFAPQTMLLSGAFSHLRRRIHNFGEWKPTGVLQLTSRKHTEEWQKGALQNLALPHDYARMVSTAEASDIAGIALKAGGIWLPEGLWLDPAAFCRWLLEHSNTRVTYHEEITKLPDAEEVILCNALAASALVPPLPLHPVRGQITNLPGANRGLKTTLSYDGYAIAKGEDICLGATFNSRMIHDGVRESDHAENISRFRQVSDAFDLGGQATGRVSYRTATPDRLPLFGRIRPGLSAILGLGSRGAALAPILAEALAARLLATPNPLPLSVQKIIEVTRYD